MIYHTMTRNRLLRLTGAKGWLLTDRLFEALYKTPTPYYEVAFYPKRALLDGERYDPEESINV